MVVDALGGLMIYEECKGDLAEMHRVAEAALRQFRQPGNAERLIDALLNDGLARLLQGESAETMRVIDAAQL